MLIIWQLTCRHVGMFYITLGGVVVAMLIPSDVDDKNTDFDLDLI